MALTDKLTAIGEAIREKSGKSAKLSLDEMPLEIRALSAEEIIKHADIPDYAKIEALDVARKVQSVRQDDSVVFLAMSDNHHYGEQGTSGVDDYVDRDGTQTNVSNLHAAMGAKALAYALNFDFAVHLGDATWGHKTTHSALLNSQIDAFFGMLAEAHNGLPCFHAIGNHDTGYYYHTNQSSGVHTESGENLYNKFTARSASDNTVFGNNQYGGYCYRDFPDKKLRVFLLNTCEYHTYNQTDKGLLGSQLKWFAEALLNLNSKSDSDKWKCIVLCHYPADYSATAPLSNLLKAYVEGSSTTISVEDGTKHTANFAGKNNARFVAQFHGHIHNFLVSKLHTQQNGTPVKFDAWRLCIPNGQYNRENYYSVVGGIDYSESVSYPKTANTAEDTSFVVNVINPSEEKIYSFCYGAGYDRVIGYAAAVYYSITNSLSNASSDNSAMSAEEGTSYTATITAEDGYDLDSITVTMGGVDVTDSVVSNGVITIPAVTGNVVITAMAIKHVNYINQLRISTDENGAVYNGTGYKAGAYLSSGNEVAKDGYYISGFIPVEFGDTIYFKNCTILAEQEYHRFAAYDDNKVWLSYRQQNTQAAIVVKAGKPVYGADGKMVSLTIGGAGDSYWSGVKYMRFCCSYLGADSVVTVNEPIE